VTLDFRFVLLALCLFSLKPAGAQTEIHKCTDADGGVVYSQLPCAPMKATQTETAEPSDTAVPSEAALPLEIAELFETSETEQEAAREEPALQVDKSSCKKHYRDAIDAIDAEIGREYTPEKAEQYKQRLLRLTTGLRQC